MEGEWRFEAYIQELAGVIGHKDREEPLRDHSRGLLTASDRFGEAETRYRRALSLKLAGAS